MHIDLDRFKQVNDSLGRATGDVLLKSIAHRIESILDWSENTDAAGDREAPFVARLGGDEFSIVVPDLDGAAVAPDDGTDADTLLQHASAATVFAKQRGLH